MPEVLSVVAQVSACVCVGAGFSFRLIKIGSKDRVFFPEVVGQFTKGTDSGRVCGSWIFIFFRLTKIGSKDRFFFPEVVGKFTKRIDSGGGDVDRF